MKNVTIDFDIPKVTKDIEEIIDQQSFDFVDNIARLTKYEIRAHIPPPKGVWKSNVNGELATGELRDSIGYEITKRGDSYHAEIGPVGSGNVQIKANVHHSGRTIRAKKKPYMTFFIPSWGWVKLKQYTIQPKGFMLTGFSKAKREIARYT